MWSSIQLDVIAMDLQMAFVVVPLCTIPSFTPELDKQDMGRHGCHVLSFIYLLAQQYCTYYVPDTFLGW